MRNLILQAKFNSVFSRIIIRLKAGNGDTITDGGGHSRILDLPIAEERFEEQVHALAFFDDLRGPTHAVAAVLVVLQVRIVAVNVA